jgi:serine/threonine protein phosphatase PrpC
MQGLLMPEQIRTHPRRSELQSALGSAPEDLLVSTVPRPWRLKPRDVFLLCTDGLWEFVDEAEMCASLNRAADPSAWLAKLEELVLQHAAERGKVGHDNFSGIAVWVGGPERGNVMPQQVVGTAVTTCTFGLGPSTFIPTPRRSSAAR